MVKFVEMDPATTYFRQLASQEEGPIVLVNKFEVPPEHETAFFKLWKEDADFMMSHGCISAQLHRGIEGSSSLLNIAVWESVGHLARAFKDPKFQAMIAQYPEGCVASPHIFKKIAVPGVCVA